MTDHAEYVRRIVDRLPPLTDEQRARLATLLRDGTPAEARVPDAVSSVTGATIIEGVGRHDPS
jgi:hypothetical protein